MTNYEWLKTLNEKDMAEVLYNSSDIWKGFIGYPPMVIEKWFESERVDCSVDDCFYKNTNACLTCWGMVRYEQ